MKQVSHVSYYVYEGKGFLGFYRSLSQRNIDYHSKTISESNLMVVW